MSGGERGAMGLGPSMVNMGLTKFNVNERSPEFLSRVLKDQHGPGMRDPRQSYQTQ